MGLQRLSPILSETKIEKTSSFYPFRSHHLQLQESCVLRTKPPPPQPHAPRKARDGTGGGEAKLSDPTAGATSIDRPNRKGRHVIERREACVCAHCPSQPATTTHGGSRDTGGPVRRKPEAEPELAGDQARREERTLAIYIWHPACQSLADHHRGCAGFAAAKTSTAEAPRARAD
jgi:hypothetical protein